MLFRMRSNATAALTAAALLLSQTKIGNSDLSSINFQSHPGITAPEKSTIIQKDLTQLTNIISAERAFLNQRAKQPASHIYAGLPSSSRNLVVVTNIGYIVGYDVERKCAAWVAYRLFDRPEGDFKVADRPGAFKPDTRIPITMILGSDPLAGTGRDHGHFAPNLAIAACYGEAAQIETFLDSNFGAQLPTLNRGPWKRAETLEFKTLRKECQEIWVIAGPIYDQRPQFVGAGNQRIEEPDAFYKIIVDENLTNSEIRTIGFIMPQSTSVKGKPLSTFEAAIARMQKETGLDFLRELPDEVEKRLESQVGNWRPYK